MSDFEPPSHPTMAMAASPAPGRKPVRRGEPSA